MIETERKHSIAADAVYLAGEQRKNRRCFMHTEKLWITKS